MSKGISKEISGLRGFSGDQILGSLQGEGLRMVIVASRFNKQLTSQLAESAVRCLKEHGVAQSEIKLVWVPGAYEIPLAVEKLARRGGCDALLALGVVIEGETQHAQMIIDSSAHSLATIARRHALPVINEIVGARTWEQARVRCSSGCESRGWYAAEAAIEMGRVARQIEDKR